MLSHATNALIRRQIRTGVQGTAVCLERTVVAAVSAPQQRPFAGGRFLALTNGSHTSTIVPRGFGTISRPLSAPSAFSASSFALYSPQIAAPHQQFLLQQAAAFFWAACSALVVSRPNRQLTFPSPPLHSLSSCRQVVLYRPDGPPSILLPTLAAVVSVFIARLNLGRDIRRYVQEKTALKDIRLEALRLLQKAYKKRQHFGSRDKWAMLDYTGPGYAVFNEALRSRSVSADVQHRIDAVVRAMSKSRIKVHTGTVYRGAALPSSIQETLLAGATFVDSAFLSSSSKISVALSSKFFSQGSTLFKIESKTGVDVSAWSKYKNEAEVLFRPSTLFKIKSVEEKCHDLHGLFTLVTMEELV